MDFLYAHGISRISRTPPWPLLLLLLTAGCVAPKRSNLVYPRRCLTINAQSFTRPCRQRGDGKLVCDGVVVSASCVEARQ